MKPRAVFATLISLGLVFLACQTDTPSADVLSPPAASAQALDPSPPDQPVKLVFLHHSVGDAWLESGDGDLGNQLGANNYYVSDT